MMARLTLGIVFVLALALLGVALATYAYHAGERDFRARLILTRSLDEQCPIVLYEDATMGCAYAD